MDSTAQRASAPRPLGTIIRDRHPVPAGRARGHDVEGADSERDQIARQGLRPREEHLLGPAALVGLGEDRRVRHGDEIFRNVQRELPRNLECRLVEARERPPREDRLELAEDVPVVSLPLPEEALGVLEVDAAPVGERSRTYSPGGEISLKVKRTKSSPPPRPPRRESPRVLRSRPRTADVSTRSSSFPFSHSVSDSPFKEIRSASFPLNVS